MYLYLRLTDMSSSRTTSLDNTPTHNILSIAPQLNISQEVLGTLPEDGNVMPKHVGVINNKLNEYLVYLLVFHAYFYWGF
jgi:hypothetical protein